MEHANQKGEELLSEASNSDMATFYKYLETMGEFDSMDQIVTGPTAKEVDFYMKDRSDFFKFISQLAMIELDFAIKYIEKKIEMEKDYLKGKILNSMKDTLVDVKKDILCFEDEMIQINQKIIAVSDDKDKMNKIFRDLKHQQYHGTFRYRINVVKKQALMNKNSNDPKEYIVLLPFKLKNILYDINTSVLITWFNQFNLIKDASHIIKANLLDNKVKHFNEEAENVLKTEQLDQEIQIQLNKIKKFLNEKTKSIKELIEIEKFGQKNEFSEKLLNQIQELISFIGWISWISG